MLPWARELLTPSRIDTNSLCHHRTAEPRSGVDVVLKAVVGDDRDELARVAARGA
jgi:hypothetical protein